MASQVGNQSSSGGVTSSSAQQPGTKKKPPESMAELIALKAIEARAEALNQAAAEGLALSGRAPQQLKAAARRVRPMSGLAAVQSIQPLSKKE